MFYRIHQNNNSKVGKQGKFYARAVTILGKVVAVYRVYNGNYRKQP